MVLVQPIKCNFLIKACDSLIKKREAFKFQQVNKAIYRGNDAGITDFVALKEKGIKTILNLKSISTENAEKLAKEAEKYGIKYVNIPLNPFFIKKAIKPIIQLIKSANSNNPLFIHCTFGKDRTGFVTALSRHIKEKMPIKDAIKDMRAHNFWKTMFFNMENFLKNIDSYIKKNNL